MDKLERLLNLTAALLDTETPLTADEIRDRVGGYPEAWLADDPSHVLARLVEAFVMRDASDLFRIQHRAWFTRCGTPGCSGRRAARWRFY